jgi:AraC-like DNA-binding protein
MDIDLHYPKNDRLKKTIEYYYFLKTDSSDFRSEYYSFPNTLQALNIHSNISYRIYSQYTHVSGISEKNNVILLQGKYQIPLRVCLEGILDKITVIFKPIGLNYFSISPISKIAGEHTQVYSDWQSDSNYESFLVSFFSETNNDARIEILENFLLQRFTEFQGASLLERAIELLSDFSIEMSVEEIASELQLHVRTFNRLFYKYVGISPVQFRKVARFRHSLKNKVVNDHFKKLTNLAYESNFYDQSYFVKIYKSLTKETPASFFNSIHPLADNQLIFRFLEK